MSVLCRCGELAEVRMGRYARPTGLSPGGGLMRFDITDRLLLCCAACGLREPVGAESKHVATGQR